MTDPYQLLLSSIAARKILKTPKIIEAFQKVRRELFIPEMHQSRSHEDKDFPIAAGQTNTAPSIVAFMLELLEPQAGQKILDVGAGSGWTTALLASITGYGGKVYGVEIMPELIDYARKKMFQLQITNVHIVPAERTLGYKKEAPYERIHVAAFCEEIPQELVDQLNDPGIMVLPVNNKIVKVVKESGTLNEEEYEGFNFAPIIKGHK